MVGRFDASRSCCGVEPPPFLLPPRVEPPILGSCHHAYPAGFDNTIGVKADHHFSIPFTAPWTSYGVQEKTGLNFSGQPYFLPYWDGAEAMNRTFQLIGNSFCGASATVGFERVEGGPDAIMSLRHGEFGTWISNVFALMDLTIYAGDNSDPALTMYADLDVRIADVRYTLSEQDPTDIRRDDNDQFIFPGPDGSPILGFVEDAIWLVASYQYFGPSLHVNPTFTLQLWGHEGTPDTSIHFNPSDWLNPNNSIYTRGYSRVQRGFNVVLTDFSNIQNPTPHDDGNPQAKSGDWPSTLTATFVPGAP